MLVRFTKHAATARTDGLACVRPDGSETRVALPRQGVLPRLALQFVVETALGWRDGAFGLVARGTPLRQVARPAKGRDGGGPALAVVRQADALADCLQADQWGGAADPAAFTARLAAACRRRGVRPPAMPAGELARLRTAVREFGAAWRPLSPGDVLERPF